MLDNISRMIPMAMFCIFATVLYFQTENMYYLPNFIGGLSLGQIYSLWSRNGRLSQDINNRVKQEEKLLKAFAKTDITEEDQADLKKTLSEDDFETCHKYFKKWGQYNP